MSKWLAATACWLMVIGCEGDPGSPGKNLLPDDLLPPSAEILLPTAAKPIHSQTAIEVRYDDDTAIDSTLFLVDGLPAATGTITPRPSSPFVFNWNCTGLALGQHTLLFMVWDSLGKRGESAQVVLNLEEWGLSKHDTLRFCNNVTPTAISRNASQFIEWKLPADPELNLTGVGVRFTPSGLFKVSYVGVWLHRAAIWHGGDLQLTIVPAENGLPKHGEPLYSRIIHGEKDSLLIDVPVTEFLDQWVMSDRRMRSTCQFSDDFFVTLTLPEANDGDTLAVYTDLGARRNGHGYRRDIAGNWSEFKSGTGRNFVPLIWVEGFYP